MAIVAAGEARAFEVIVDRHAGSAFSLALRICARRAVAEDVVQEAFLALWRAAARYECARGSVRSWVLTIVRNQAIDTLRANAIRERRNVNEPALVEQLASDRRTEAEVEHREDCRMVQSALAGLPADQRQVVELAYFGGFTHLEIAGRLALPQGTVKGRMRLGLAKLRIALGDSL